MSNAITKPASEEGVLVKNNRPAISGPAPYVAFRGAKTAKNVEDLDDIGIEVDQFYLVDGQPWKVNPMQLHLIDFRKFYTKQSRTFELLEASDNPAPGLEDHIEAVVLVVRPGGEGNPSSFTPARMTLRGGHAAALRFASGLYNTAKDTPADLISCGGEYLPGSKCKVVGGRFRIAIRSEQKESKKTGNMYNNGIGRILPTPEKDVAVINSFAEEGVNKDKLMHVAAAWAERVAEIEAMID